MKKPVIGVLPLWDEEKESIWMLPGYMQGIEAAGGTPVILSLSADVEALQYWAESLEGFLFTGGQDVDPALYGEEKLPSCGELCAQRDRIETVLLKTLIQLGKPAFGICRGLQLFNVALGGTLYQDIPTQMARPLLHESSSSKEVACHEVKIAGQSPLQSTAVSDSFTVNSYHHQGVKDLAPELQAAARSEDGLVEAAWMPGQKFVFAVQWHPELNFGSDRVSMELFRRFVDAAKTA